MRRKAFSLAELLTIVAVIAVLSAILFPVFVQAKAASKVSNKPNLQKIAKAALAYGSDYDDRIPIMINGYYRDLKNTADGQLTSYGEQRTDGWSHLLVPYLGDRSTYRDPRRDDVNNIWSGPPLATTDPGYVTTANTYRNQTRFPFYGVNSIFLSPLRIPDSHFDDPNPTDFMVGESKAFFDADRPQKTIFYTVSTRGYVAQDFSDNFGVQDTTRGFWAVNAPGMWGLVQDLSPYIIFWNGTYCSGDWCGDADTQTPGDQRTQNFNFIEPLLGGNNVAYLDGHVQFMSDVDMADGTNYLSATPNDAGTGYFGGGAVITNKRQYRWNLDDNYYGIY